MRSGHLPWHRIGNYLFGGLFFSLSGIGSKRILLFLMAKYSFLGMNLPICQSPFRFGV